MQPSHTARRDKIDFQSKLVIDFGWLPIIMCVFVCLFVCMYVCGAAQNCIVVIYAGGFDKK
jgi:hypothetical protein